MDSGDSGDSSPTPAFLDGCCSAVGRYVRASTAEPCSVLVAVLAFGLIKVRVSSSEVRVSSSGYRSTYLLYLLGGDLEELDDLRVILPDGPVQRRVPGLCG
eukprot:scaffold4827_cov48-Phaeocystis_antarctica.AAC.1